jgi:hypothetical protein
MDCIKVETYKENDEEIKEYFLCKDGLDIRLDDLHKNILIVKNNDEEFYYNKLIKSKIMTYEYMSSNYNVDYEHYFAMIIPDNNLGNFHVLKTPDCFVLDSDKNIYIYNIYSLPFIFNKYNVERNKKFKICMASFYYKTFILIDEKIRDLTLTANRANITNISEIDSNFYIDKWLENYFKNHYNQEELLKILKKDYFKTDKIKEFLKEEDNLIQGSNKDLTIPILSFILSWIAFLIYVFINL